MVKFKVSSKLYVTFKLLVLILLAVTFVYKKSYAGVDETCEAVKYIKSTPTEQTRVLNYIKRSMMYDAKESIKSINQTREYLSNCETFECEQMLQSFQNILVQQMHVAKIVKAINKRNGINIKSRSYADFKVSRILTMMSEQKLYPNLIADFNLEGFNFSSEDRQDALRLWSNVYIRMAILHNNDYRLTLSKTKKYFKQLSYDLMAINPLLAFLTDESVLDSQQIIMAFDKMIEFNNYFISQVEGFKVNPQDNLGSQFNLSNKDHEMGLVNFPIYMGRLIDIYRNDDAQKITLCSSWKDLVDLQTKRIRSSIGVGFSMAVICGAGVWSGLGAPVAAATCLPAVLDGLWGARRGLLDARISHAALYSGVKLYKNGEFSEGIMTPELSASKTTQGHIVFMINVLGLIPIGKAVAATSKHSRGALFDLFKVPSADVAVSTFEGVSSNVAYATLVLRGSEAIQNEFKNEISRLTIQALSGY